MKKVLTIALFVASVISIEAKVPLITFFVEAVKNFKQVGTVFPTSKYVGSEAIKYIKQHEGQKCILEIGAGIGNITSIIKDELKEGDILDVIEIDESYCEILRNKFADDPRIKIWCTDILKFNPDYKYDYIISTIPHNSLDTDFVKALVEQYKNLIKPSGKLAYVEYIGFSKVTLLKTWGQARKQYKEKLSIMKKFKSDNNGQSSIVVRNVPPIFVHHLSF